MTTLLVIAKEPVPGRVKTRLTPPFTPAEAAALAEAALADTLAVALATPADRHVLVLDGSPARGRPRGSRSALSAAAAWTSDWPPPSPRAPDRLC